MRPQHCAARVMVGANSRSRPPTYDAKPSAELDRGASALHRHLLMRVLQVVSLLSLDGAFGGLARVALNQSAELVRQGHDVTLAAGTRGYRVVPTESQASPCSCSPSTLCCRSWAFPG